MCPDPSRSDVRIARLSEFARLREIEQAADAMFTEAGMGSFADDGEEDHLDEAAIVFVSGDPPVGFASVGTVDTCAHLWQLAVHPSESRRGRGTALVAAVCAWADVEGYREVTLTTFRDVPWNGPFYSEMGFSPVEDLTPGLMVIRARETRLGHDRLGPRIAMRKELRLAPGP